MTPDLDLYMGFGANVFCELEAEVLISLSGCLLHSIPGKHPHGRTSLHSEPI